MLTSYIIYLISVNLIAISDSQIAKCYHVKGTENDRFPIYWNESITFIPKHLYVYYTIEDGKWLKNHTRPTIRFDVEMIDEACPNNALPFPDTSSSSGERMHGGIFLQYWISYFMIEAFRIYAWNGFKEGRRMVSGLERKALIPVDFKPELKSLPPYKTTEDLYFQRLPHLQTGEKYCLQLLDTERDIRLQLSGNCCEKESVYDHYFVTFAAQAADGSRISQLRYLAKTYICSRDTELFGTQIGVDMSTAKLVITLDGGFDVPALKTVYEKKDGKFKMNPESSEFELSKLFINRGSRVADYPRSVILFPIKREKVKCTSVDEFSYVEKEVYQSKTIGYKTVYGDHSTDDEKILIMRPAEKHEIDSCLK